MRRIISGSVLLLQICIAFGSAISEQECEHYPKGMLKFDDDQADARKYPYVVRVFIDGSGDYKNGVLISQSFVLTSGLWSSETVRVEVGFLSTDTNRTKSIAIGRQIRYPGNGVESLCLLEMIQPINQFDDFIRPICLSNGPIGVNAQYTEVSTIEKLQTRQINSMILQSSGDLVILLTNSDSPADHTYDGTVLLNSDNEVAGIKAEFELSGYDDSFFAIQHYLGWIEQYVWPVVPTKEPIPSNTRKRSGSITVFVALFLNALI